MPRETVHVGRKIRVEVDTFTAPDGTVIRRDLIRHPGAVVILPVLDEKLHLFVAEDLTPGPASPEACEQLEPVTVAFPDAIRMCLSGEIKDAKTITTLLLWERMANGQA